MTERPTFNAFKAKALKNRAVMAAYDEAAPAPEPTPISPWRECAGGMGTRQLSIVSPEPCILSIGHVPSSRRPKKSFRISMSCDSFSLFSPDKR